MDTLPRSIARSVLKKLGISNVNFKIGDGSLGWEEHAPFNGIIVTAGAPKIPDTLLNQLATGGKIVIPIGNRSSQRLIKIVKGEKIMEKYDICGCVFVPLVGDQGWKDV